MKNPIELNQIILTMERKKYQVFRAPLKPYNLNLVGIRASDPTPNIFNDQLWVFWKDGSNYDKSIYRITTDPGTYWLKNPMVDLGTAILKPGQYLGMWKIGMHRNYEALIQQSPCTVIRDFNRDGKYDYDSGREETGFFGINLHHAGEDSQTVDKHSAGCQVFQSLDCFNEFMDLARKARNYWGNTFTYTLLKEEDIL